MTNPFENLGKKESEIVDDWEDVEDSVLACQKCHKIVTTGRYSDSKQILVWKCACGHMSTMTVKL
jgi:lysyl-tRNA synthetase class I